MAEVIPIRVRTAVYPDVVSHAVVEISRVLPDLFLAIRDAQTVTEALKIRQEIGRLVLQLDTLESCALQRASDLCR